MATNLLLVTPTGELSRRARLFIQHAPTGVVINVKRMTSKISGYHTDRVVVDAPLAELKGQDDE
jgi:hypothetical protein